MEQSWFFNKISNINKPLARLSEKKRTEQITNIGIKTEALTTEPADIKITVTIRE